MIHCYIVTPPKITISAAEHRNTSRNCGDHDEFGASPIQDKNIGVQQIHSQLEIMHLELQSLNKGKESQPGFRVEVSFLNCKGHGHDKEHCPIYHNYLIWGEGGDCPTEARKHFQAKCKSCSMVRYFPGYRTACNRQLSFTTEVCTDPSVVFFAIFSIL